MAARLAATARGELVVELIVDGVNLAPRTVRAGFELVGPRVRADGSVGGADGVARVTDAMAAAGMVDGIYQLGPMGVQVVDGVARLADGSSIAGGAAT